jgi:hypothetical protein
MRGHTIGNRRTADDAFRASSMMFARLRGLLDHLKGLLRSQESVRLISSKDATLTGLAESPHTTVHLSSDECERAREIEQEAHSTEAALF